MHALQRVGFVGLGRMGYPMAGHLARAGYRLRVADRDPQRVQRFTAEHAAEGASSLAALAAEADAVITMLPTSADVRQVVLGDGGSDCIASALAPGSLVIDSGTSDPVDTRRLAAALAARDVHVVDAPVAGGVAFARDATLDVLVGGSAEAIARCRPLLETLGGRLHECGPVGSAHAVKALNNFVNACSLVTLIEALSIGRRFGVPMDILVGALEAATTGRNHPLHKKVLPQILTRRFSSGMDLGLIAKDVGIAESTAAACDAYAPVVAQLSELWHEAARVLGDDCDQTEVARLWEARNGITLEGGRE